MRKYEMSFFSHVVVSLLFIPTSLKSQQSQDARPPYTWRMDLEKNNPMGIPADGNFSIKLNQIISAKEVSVEVFNPEESRAFSLYLKVPPQNQPVTTNISIYLINLDKTKNVATVDVQIKKLSKAIAFHTFQIVKLQLEQPYRVEKKDVILQLDNIENGLKKATITLTRVTNDNSAVKATVQEGSYIFFDTFGTQGLQVEKITKNSVELIMIE